MYHCHSPCFLRLVKEREGFGYTAGEKADRFESWIATGPSTLTVASAFFSSHSGTVWGKMGLTGDGKIDGLVKSRHSRESGNDKPKQSRHSGRRPGVYQLVDSRFCGNDRVETSCEVIKIRTAVRGPEVGNDGEKETGFRA